MSDPIKQTYETFSPHFHYDPMTKIHELDMEKKRRALVKILTDAKDVDDARLLMEALGYLPYGTFARMNNRVMRTTTDRSSTNGYLESIGRL